MAKKSTKSSRRARTKKEQAPKKTTTQQDQTAPAEPMITTEGSDEPVVKTDDVAPDMASPENAASAASEAEAGDDASAQPSRRRAILSALALAVVAIALIFGSAIMRQHNESQAAESTQPGQDSATADDILQSGGTVCANQQATSDTNGSTNPQSVGMMLQTNPSNSVQTPQTFGGGGSDAAALQGATCF